MTYFPFYNMCMCSHRKGEWSREDKDINIFFLHGSEEIMVAVVNFYQDGSALSPVPFARHYSDTDREQAELKNTAI